jgi:hypothetical protein
MKKTALVAAFCAVALCSKAQTQDDNQVKVEFHGFVNNEVMYDTRQVSYGREGEVLILPKDKDLDINNVDKNAHGELSMFNFHTRLQAVIAGPTIGTFKSSALIEGDFLGSNDNAPNMLRMRHAFFKLSNDKHEWLIGQYWHPMFVPECFPDIVGWNVGLPVHVLNRAPQIRYSYMPSAKLKFNLVALSQRDFASHGPKTEKDDTNTASSTYLKRSGIPDMQAQVVAKPTDKMTLGCTAGYKVITPRIVTANNYSVNETLGSYNLNAFARYKTAKTTLMVEGIYGQNLSHFLMLGGYGVKTVDPVTDERTYTNIVTSSVWADISHQVSPKVRIGIFAGYVKNNGSSDEVAQVAGKYVTYGVGTNVDNVISISPRVTYAVKRVKFSVEVNNLTAAYGTIKNDLTVADTHNVTNNRFLFSSTYSF